MTFDLAADPWGLAMLAAAALWALSCLLLLAAFVAHTPQPRGFRMLGVSSLAFLTAALGGTWQRIERPNAAQSRTTTALGPERSVPTASAEPTTADPGRDSGTSDGPRATPDDPEPRASSGSPPSTPRSAGFEPGPTLTANSESESESESESTAPPAGVDAASEVTSPEPLAEAAPAQAAPASSLPSDPKQRRWAMATIMRQSEEVSGNPRSCARLDAVAEAWARLKQVPASGRSRSLVRKLEKCRRKLLYSISRRHRRAQVDARDAFAERLADALREQHGETHWVSISGRSHERIRISAGSLDATRADALMSGALGRDLDRLAFARVALSNGKKTKVYEFNVTPDRELGLPDLRAVGLGEPLELPES